MSEFFKYVSQYFGNKYESSSELKQVIEAFDESYEITGTEIILRMRMMNYLV